MELFFPKYAPLFIASLSHGYLSSNKTKQMNLPRPGNVCQLLAQPRDRKFVCGQLFEAFLGEQHHSTISSRILCVAVN